MANAKSYKNPPIKKVLIKINYLLNILINYFIILIYYITTNLLKLEN